MNEGMVFDLSERVFSQCFLTVSYKDYAGCWEAFFRIVCTVESPFYSALAFITTFFSG